VTPVAGAHQSDQSEGEGLTTDGENGAKRRMVVEVQEQASRELMEELKGERDDLLAEFDEQTDLKSKMLIQGIHKVTVLGMIKYH